MKTGNIYHFSCPSEWTKYQNWLALKSKLIINEYTDICFLKKRRKNNNRILNSFHGKYLLNVKCHSVPRKTIFICIEDNFPLEFWCKLNTSCSLNTLNSTPIRCTFNIFEMHVNFHHFHHWNCIFFLFCFIVQNISTPHDIIQYDNTVKGVMMWLCIYRYIIQLFHILYKQYWDGNRNTNISRHKPQIGTWLCIIRMPSNIWITIL